MQFPAFSGSELVNQEDILGIKEHSQKIKYLIW